VHPHKNNTGDISQHENMVKLDDVDPHLYWEEKNTKGLTTKCFGLQHQTRGKRIWQNRNGIVQTSISIVPAIGNAYACH